MADSWPCSLDRLVELWQKILKMQSRESVCRAPARKSSPRQCVTCNETLQRCSQCRLAAPTKRSNDLVHQDDCCQTSSKRFKGSTKIETAIELKKEFKDTSKESTSHMRAGFTGNFEPEPDPMDTGESFRGDVIFVLEDSETDGGAVHECQASHRLVLISPEIYFS